MQPWWRTTVTRFPFSTRNPRGILLNQDNGMSDDQTERATPHPPEWFGTTHWSVVLAVGEGDPALARAALERLCQSYWYPLYAFLRRSGKSPHDAEDLVQSFFAVCIEKDYLAAADREKGRFRSFLLLALKRFLANEYHKRHAAKRGGAHPMVALDALAAEERYAIEPVDRLSADKLFDRRWALTLLEQVLARLQQEQAAAGRAALFEHLKVFLVAGEGGPAYAELAARLSLSESALKVAVHRLRQRYRALLNDELANTVSSPTELEAERRHLLEALSN
jgi:RNA polymerase sigma factor (sigma-70 family)